LKIILRILKKWLPLAVATAGLCGLIYLTVQQSLRMGANDPQIQMAEDAASKLEGDASLDSILPANQVELTTSLAAFLMVFDDSGNLLSSSAVLHGQVPVYPSGVLEYTRQHGEDRVTWQPEPGVRMATVVQRFNKGFVMAGRSLREVEIRATNTEMLCGIAMLVIWVVTFILVALGEIFSPSP
jgi:hypothetical protein